MFKKGDYIVGNARAGFNAGSYWFVVENQTNGMVDISRSMTGCNVFGVDADAFDLVRPFLKY